MKCKMLYNFNILAVIDVSYAVVGLHCIIALKCTVQET